MSAKPGSPGDQVRVSVLVAVPPEVAFHVFTEDIDVWWRRGPAYRVAGLRRGAMRLESDGDVTFAESPKGTLVTATHRGWSTLRPSHPVQHGLETTAFARMKGIMVARADDVNTPACPQ